MRMREGEGRFTRCRWWRTVAGEGKGKGENAKCAIECGWDLNKSEFLVVAGSVVRIAGVSRYRP